MWQGEDEEESSVPDGLEGLFGLDSNLELAGLLGLESLVGFLIGSTRSKESDVSEEEAGDSLSCLGLDGSGSSAALRSGGVTAVSSSSSGELSMPSSSMPNSSRSSLAVDADSSLPNICEYIGVMITGGIRRLGYPCLTLIGLGKYRVTLVFEYLGWVDFDLGSSTILLGH